MSYFFLSEAVRTAETGNQHPQILKMSKEQDFDDDNGVYVFSRIPMPETSPDLRYLILDPKAKLTDVLSAAMLRLTGLLVNAKARAILENLSLPTHKFYKAEVLEPGTNNIFEYYWLQVAIDYTLSAINLSKSEFVLTTTGIIPKTIKTLSIKSVDDYEKAKSQMPPRHTINVSKAIIRDDWKHDLFRIPQVGLPFIASSRAKEELLKVI